MSKNTPKKRATIKTIAEIAGVSHVAVSRALRGCSDISQATTERILKIAKDVGYTPNAFARSLSSKKSYSIGMIVPAMGDGTVYADIFNAVSSHAAANGLVVLLGSCSRDAELEKQFCRTMCEYRVGALIVSPISSDISHIKEICSDIVPLIFIGGKTGLEEENCIAVDYAHSGKLAVDHLYSLGHRDIALFLYHPDNNTTRMKLNGYKDAMASYNLTPKVYWEGDSSDTFSAGKAIAKRLISQNELPTAIWCASDLMAIGVIDALKGSGISVPNDICVMGHDNLFFTELDSFSLTTFSLPKQEMGIYAVNIALDIMKSGDGCKSEDSHSESGKDSGADFKRKALFKAKLIQRNSTKKAKS